jgi:PncC family amidohydrolase
VENSERPEHALAHRAGELLRAQRLVLAVAESCTGGGLGDAVTDIAGSSDYFTGGVIAYSYEAKERLLGVPQSILAAKGAVSPEVVTLMAANVRRLLGADLSLALSGIAGPGSGLPGKSVGLVYIALASAEGTSWRRYDWQGDRIENKRASVCAALEWLIEYLSGEGQSA